MSKRRDDGNLGDMSESDDCVPNGFRFTTSLRHPTGTSTPCTGDRSVIQTARLYALDYFLPPPRPPPVPPPPVPSPPPPAPESPSPSPGPPPSPPRPELIRAWLSAK